MAIHFDASDIVVKEENKRRKELKQKMRDLQAMAEIAKNKEKENKMKQKEEKFKKAGLEPGRNIPQRSRKPKVSKGE